ncbi:bifunctional oligoribonuclease/PAP phosphatase NrnA [Vallitalea pronyensis]|uniref:Bifunctional oligoribonuclease/PAP phosphatase NrnA n=1 Tax=Vallitalea pronyensis TaxID=1348613 RepID=A0A8J8SH49_9FIRM|nr:bifunctional oligoribonuclease/PAP phosphatase NrnA [Vallitalea pronyensis]QUI22993.1 bifunctional oligoribonuclease/PAP phosphatase NrnA [Vallitalea pronyensis]
MKLQELVNLCENQANIIISGHINPDGDCIGACYALAAILHKKGIHAKIAMEDIPDTFNYLVEGRLYVEEDQIKRSDVFIALDCGDKERLGPHVPLFDQASITINVDHHISNNHFADYNHVVEASSTCEIIFEMLEDTSLLDKPICEALYTGIAYDTGAFKHCNTTRRTYEIAGTLIDYGVNFNEIINRLYYYKSYKSFKVLGLAIANAKMYLDNVILLTSLSLEDLKRYDCEKKDTDGVVQMLNEVMESSCAVFIVQVSQDTFKVSLRSSSGIDVCKVAQVFGGGGHTKASGCTITGTIEQVKEQIIEAITEQL